MNRGTKLYLEVEDTCIAMLEALSRGDHSGQESGVQSEGGSGRKKPAVTWEERLGLREQGKKAQGGEAERGMRGDRKSTRLNSSHKHRSRMPSSA